MAGLASIIANTFDRMDILALATRIDLILSSTGIINRIDDRILADWMS